MVNVTIYGIHTNPMGTRAKSGYRAGIFVSKISECRNSDCKKRMCLMIPSLDCWGLHNLRETSEHFKRELPRIKDIRKFSDFPPKKSGKTQGFEDMICWFVLWNMLFLNVFQEYWEFLFLSHRGWFNHQPGFMIVSCSIKNGMLTTVFHWW